MAPRHLILCAISVVMACSDRHPATNDRPGNLALSADSLRCGQLDAHNRCSLYNASLYDLITQPAEWHGKRVRVIGFAHFEFEGNSLFAHREDCENSLFMNGVWLNPPREGVDSLTNRYLIVEGRFNAQMRGHMGMWSGSLDSVTRYGVWALPGEPSRATSSVPRCASQHP